MKALQRLERDRGSDKNRPLRDEVLVSEATRTQGKASVVQLLLGTSVGVVFASALVGAWWFLSLDMATTPAAVAAAPPQTPAPAQAVLSAIPTNPTHPTVTAGSPRTAPALPVAPAPSPVPSAPAPSLERAARPEPSAPMGAPMTASVREEVQETAQETGPKKPALIEETVSEKPPVEPTPVVATGFAALGSEVERIESPVLEVEVVEETVEETMPEGVEEVSEAPSPASKEEVVVVIQESVKEEAVVEKGMTFPEFFVQKTVWHPRADKRVAYIAIPKDSDPKSVREGETIEDLEVLTIEPAAVILGRDGVEVRKRVGEE